ncbi:TetR/AcrR family transcriptional regulator [Micromonospora sp. NBC_01796]|uniref:TetR/AcrR family transcriptional regulator n=1 Tax=Micromonospora sp. NBC_01796 TaxID=2975987 RepID=UPI002DDA24E6|nr:TetR family transcriptional regulator [Micromonospora sp. NBC_01796]WSA82860.1 TetR family transcriptional regulator [Micromonospora sp. NBC_01796]
MADEVVGFQRARRPEQVKLRRNTILDTAAAMLAERPVAEISLRELSDRVGLAKSNVLRYFDSREAIFLEVLDATWTTWLDGVEVELGAAVEPGNPAPYQRETRVATLIADSLSKQPLLCELISTMVGTLERNISLDSARTSKRRAAANTDRLTDLVRAQLPHLGRPAAAHFAGAALVLVAGLWPSVAPTEAVATVTAELGAPPAEVSFPHDLREALANQLIGLSVRATLAPEHP